MIGNFNVMPFALEHDVPCFGFIVHHPECGILVYLTDTMYSKVVFGMPVNHWLIEANYDSEILDELDKSFLRERVMNSHMSIETTLGLLKCNDLSKTRTIVLCHLSDRNSDAKAFEQRAVHQTGKPVYIAKPGLVLEIDHTPF